MLMYRRIEKPRNTSECVLTLPALTCGPVLLNFPHCSSLKHVTNSDCLLSSFSSFFLSPLLVPPSLTPSSLLPPPSLSSLLPPPSPLLPHLSSLFPHPLPSSPSHPLRSLTLVTPPSSLTLFAPPSSLIPPPSSLTLSPPPPPSPFLH